MICQLPSFERAYGKLMPAAQSAVTDAIAQMAAAFGRPHLHGGIGLRPFGRYYELRAGQNLRVLFIVEGGDFFLATVGNHDQVRNYLKNNR
jgi:hypothetical protein